MVMVAVVMIVVAIWTMNVRFAMVVVIIVIVVTVRTMHMRLNGCLAGLGHGASCRWSGRKGRRHSLGAHPIEALCSDKFSGRLECIPEKCRCPERRAAIAPKVALPAAACSRTTPEAPHADQPR